MVHLLPKADSFGWSFAGPVWNTSIPEEILVDKIAGELAFYPPIFVPILLEEIGENKRLTFAAIDRVRQRIAPEASWHATLLAAVRHSPRTDLCHSRSARTEKERGATSEGLVVHGD